MAQIKKITSSLSVAATVLLEACSSSGSNSGPTPVANTTAPQLVATWQTDCIVTDISGSTSTNTQASGGSFDGSISGGAAYRIIAIFNQDGRVEFITEIYGTSNCNPSKRTSNRYNAVYFVGGPGQANDNSPAIEIKYSDSSSSTYSIFQLVNSTSLYLGDATTSSPGYDGGSEATRLDGLGTEMLKN